MGAGDVPLVVTYAGPVRGIGDYCSRSARLVSLQIIGHGYDEARVLRIGRAFESATDWHERRPDLSALLDP